MKNKNVGFLIVGIAVVIGVIVMIFNMALKEIVGMSCDHGLSCSMYDTIAVQTNVSLAIAGLVLVIGLFFIFTKEEERVVVRKVKEKVYKKKIDKSKLDRDEKKVIEVLERENGAVFQSSLMEEMEIGKVKTTRLLDKLEAKQIVERKRRGMNNIVVLKNL